MNTTKFPHHEKTCSSNFGILIEQVVTNYDRRMDFKACPNVRMMSKFGEY